MSTEGNLSSSFLQFTIGSDTVTLLPSIDSLTLQGTLNNPINMLNINSISTITNGNLILATTGPGRIIINSASQTMNPVTSSIVGSIVEIKAQTYTSSSLTFITNHVFNSVAQNVVNSISATTFGTVSNFYISANPIAATTNAILSNSLSLWSAGSSRFDSTMTINSTLNVTSLATFGSISATSLNSTYITVSTLNVIGPIVSNNLTVSTLTVNGPSNFNGPMIATNATFNGTTTFTGTVIGVNTGSGSPPGGSNTQLQYNANGVFGGSSITWTSATNNTAISGTLGVTSLATFGPLSATSITVSGPSTFSSLSATSITVGTLSVSGPSSFNGPMVTTNATFNGTTTFTGTVIGVNTGAGSPPGGSNTQLQYNANGVFGGSSITWTSATNNTNISGTLGVTSLATFGPLSSSSITVSGPSTFSSLSATSITVGTLSVSGPSSFNGPMVATNATFNGTTTFAGTVIGVNTGSGTAPGGSNTQLQYNANGVFGGSSITWTSATNNTVISGTLGVTSLATFGPLSATSITVSGPSTFSSLSATSITVGTLSVSGPSNFNGPMVTTNATFNGTSTFTGRVIGVNTGSGTAPGGSNTQLQYNANGVFGGSSITWTSATNNTAISGTLGVTSLATFGPLSSSSITVSGPSTFSSLSATSITVGTLSVSGPSNFNGPMVATNATFNGTTTFTGTVIGVNTGSGTAPGGSNTQLQYNANGVFGGTSITWTSATNNTTISGTLSVTSLATFGPLSATSITVGTLSVSGPSNFNGPMVATNATFNGTTTFTGTVIGVNTGSGTAPGGSNTQLQYNANGVFGGSSITWTSATNNTNISGTLGVTSLATFGPLSATSITVSGPSTFSSLSAASITVGTLSVSGPSSFNGPMVATNATFNGTTTFTGTVIGVNTGSGTAPGGSNTQLQYNANGVFGGSSITWTSATNNTVISGTLGVTSLATFGPLSATSITVSGPSTFSSLSATSITVGTLSVSGPSSFNGPMVATNATFNGTTTFTGTVIGVNTGSGTAPGGSNTQLQYNANGVFGGTSITWTSATNNTAISGTLGVTSLAIFGPLSATSITVSGPSTFSSLSATSITVGTLSVSGPSNFNGPMVTTNATFNGTTTFTGTVIGVNTGSGTAPGGSNTQLQYNANGVFGGTNITWTSANNNTAISGTLGVTSLATFGPLSATSITVSGPSTFSSLSATSITVGTLAVSGPSNFNGPMVSTNATFNGTTTFTGTVIGVNTGSGTAPGGSNTQLQYNANGVFGGSSITWTSATNNTAISGTLGVTSLATFGPLSATSITVSGPSTFSSLSATSITVGTLAVSGPSNFNGPMVTTNATFNGTSTFTGRVIGVNTGSGTAPGGSNTQLQYNANGVFGGTNITWTSATNNTAISGTLGVTSLATFGPLSATSITVSGPSTFSSLSATSITVGTLSVSGPSNFNGPMVATNATFNGTTTFTGTVIGVNTGSGTAPGGSNTQLQYNANGVFGGSSITWTSATNNTNISGTLGVTSLATFGPLSATSITVGTLAVSGPSTFSSLSATSITVGTLAVSGPSNFNGPMVTTNATFNGTSTFTGRVIGVNTGSGTAPGGSNTQLQYNANGVFGGTNITWTSATNNTNISGTLGVTSLATFGPLSATSITVSGPSTFSSLSATSITVGTLSVSGPSSFNGPMVATNATFNGTTTFTGTVIGVNTGSGGGTPGGSNTQLQYNANGVFGGSSITWTSATNNTTISGTLGVTSLATFGPLSATSITVSGPSTFNSLSATSITVGTLSVSGPSSFNGPMVATNATFNGTTTFTGTVIGVNTGSGGSGTPGGSNTQLQYNANGVFGGTSITWTSSTNNTNISGTLVVTSLATFGPLSATSITVGTLSVSGPTNIGGPLVVTSNATFSSIGVTSASIGYLFATSSNLRTYQAVVAITGGDYTLVSSALNAGAKSIFVRAGTYIEPAPITISSTTSISIIGENMNLTIIDFNTQATGFNLSGITKATPGVINATSGSATITGTGTTFTNFVAGDYILITESFYKIASVIGVTTLTLTNVYQGPSFTSQSYIGSTMGSCIFSNFTINSTTISNVINLSSFIGSTISDININRGSVNLFQGSIDIDGLAINSSLSLTAALNIKNMYESQLSSLMIYSSSSRGLNILDSKNFGISTSNITNNITEGIYIDFTAIQTNTSNITINNISSDNNASDGINLATNGRSINVNGSNFNYNRNYGIQCDARQCSIGNCVMFNNGLNSPINAGGIRTSGNYNNISNCYIRNSEGIVNAGISNGIDVSGTYSNISQTNIFGYSSGILIGNPNITVSNCSIDTNTIMVLVGSSVSNTTIDANIFRNGTFGITVGSNSTSNNNIISANQFLEINNPVVVYAGANTLINGNNFITATTQINIQSLASNTTIINNIFPVTPGSTAVFDSSTGTSYFGNTINATTYAVLSSGIIRITNSDPSTSGTTGAIQVTSGGIGVTGPSFFGNTVDVTNIISTTATSSSTNISPLTANMWSNVQNIGSGHISVSTVQTVAVTSWVTQTTASLVFTKICWSSELGLFAATTTNIAGTSGSIVTSPDGITWTNRTPGGAGAAYIGVCWAPQIRTFVAVKATSTLAAATSADGVTWTIRTTPAGTNWNAVCWSPSLNLFLAVTGSGAVGTAGFTSPNGINWTARTIGAVVATHVGCCWSETATGGSATLRGLFVSVNQSGVAATSIYTSNDGTTWTARTAPNTNVLQAVCWSDELSLFCTVANTGTGNRVNTSSDGVTWVSRTSAEDNAWDDICWSPQLAIFCTVAATTGTSSIMTSPDGITWSLSSHPSKSLSGIAWSPTLNLFAAVSNSGAAVTNIITNIFPTTGFTNRMNIGTDAITTIDVNGKVVNIGNRASRVNIGSYADNIFIGGINFNNAINSTIIAAARVTAAGVLTYSYNILSVGVATNIYTLTFINVPLNTNYYVVANCIITSGFTRIVMINSINATNFVVATKTDTNATTATEFDVIVYQNSYSAVNL